MNKLLKTVIAGVSALTMCISVMPLSANAATQYQKGDINGDGIVNSSDVLAIKKFLNGNLAAKDGAMTERLDVNSDYIIDINDVALLKNINLGTANGGTISYKNTTNLPTQETKTYYKYNASTGAYKGQYTLNPVSNISTTSASTCSIIDKDERWAEDGLDGVLCVGDGTAFVIDSHTILTAAHCLRDISSGRDVNSKAISNLEFKVCNSRNEKTRVAITPIEYQLPAKFVNAEFDVESTKVDKERSKYDYAIITVEEDLSKYVNFNLGVVRNELYTTNANSQKLLFATGFGGSGTNVNKELIDIKSTGDGFLTDVPTKYNLRYDIDNIGGDSGGPIYANVKGKQTVIGIVTSSGINDNGGVRLTTDILNLIYHHK